MLYQEYSYIFFKSKRSKFWSTANTNFWGINLGEDLRINAWGDQEHPTDNTFINSWQAFLQTPSGLRNVPDWFDKLQAVIQSQESESESSEQPEATREEWMILSDLHTPLTTPKIHQNHFMTGMLTEVITLNKKSMKCHHG